MASGLPSIEPPIVGTKTYFLLSPRASTRHAADGSLKKKTILPPTRVQQIQRRAVDVGDEFVVRGGTQAREIRIAELRDPAGRAGVGVDRLNHPGVGDDQQLVVRENPVEDFRSAVVDGRAANQARVRPTFAACCDVISPLESCPLAGAATPTNSATHTNHVGRRKRESLSITVNVPKWIKDVGGRMRGAGKDKYFLSRLSMLPCTEHPPPCILKCVHCTLPQSRVHPPAETARWTVRPAIPYIKTTSSTGQNELGRRWYSQRRVLWEAAGTPLEPFPGRLNSHHEVWRDWGHRPLPQETRTPGTAASLR